MLVNGREDTHAQMQCGTPLEVATAPARARPDVRSAGGSLQGRHRELSRADLVLTYAVIGRSLHFVRLRFRTG